MLEMMGDGAPARERIRRRDEEIGSEVGHRGLEHTEGARRRARS